MQKENASMNYEQSGFFAGAQSICILLCNVLAGILWQQFGAPVVFMVAASGALVAAVFLSVQKLKLMEE